MFVTNCNKMPDLFYQQINCNYKAATEKGETDKS